MVLLSVGVADPFLVCGCGCGCGCGGSVCEDLCFVRGMLECVCVLVDVFTSVESLSCFFFLELCCVE